MQLSLTTQIAGRKTVSDWIALKSSLLADVGNIDLWTTAFNDFYISRLNGRYMNPIKSIKESGEYTGEGFSIMTIICSLIEFLETTYQGKNYRFRRASDPPLGPFEYSASSQIFADFLTNHSPFSTYFNLQTSNEFYKNIRCGLLHEARTNGNWTIWGGYNKGNLIKKHQLKQLFTETNSMTHYLNL